MKKPHSMSPQSADALRVLGLQIGRARRDRRWTQIELAERVGVSDATVRLVERGVPTVAIGTVFEMAAILGIPLITPEPADLPALVAQSRDRLAVLPARVRTRAPQVSDDF